MGGFDRKGAEAGRDARRGPREAASLPEQQGVAPAGPVELLGNRAMLQLLRSGRLQRKPRVSEPGDPLERQADRAAEAAIAGPVRDKPARPSREAPEVQREPIAPEEELASEPGAPGKARVLAPPPPYPGDEAPSDSSLARQLLSGLGPGEPLSRQTRAFMESRFEASFDGVRIHAGEPAASAARAVSARAFTVGQNIVFGEREYEPGSVDGRRLLAHELAHTLQQRSGAGVGEIQRQSVEEGAPIATTRPSVTGSRSLAGEKYVFKVSVEGQRVAYGQTSMGGVFRYPSHWDAATRTLTIHVYYGPWGGFSEDPQLQSVANSLGITIALQPFQKWPPTGEPGEAEGYTPGPAIVVFPTKEVPPKPQPKPPPPPKPTPKPPGPVGPSPGAQEVPPGPEPLTPEEQARLDERMRSVRASLSEGRAGIPNVVSALEALDDAQLRAITLEERLQMIRALADLHSLSRDEQHALNRLLETAPERDAKQLISLLGEDNARLVRRLHELMHGEQYTQMHRAVRRLFMESLTSEQREAARRSAPPVSGRNVELTSDGHIRVTHLGMTLSPFQMVAAGTLDVSGQPGPEGVVYMPAFNLLLESEMRGVQGRERPGAGIIPWLSLPMMTGMPLGQPRRSPGPTLSTLDDNALQGELLRTQEWFGEQFRLRSSPLTPEFNAKMDRLADLEHEAVRRGLSLGALEYNGVRFGSERTKTPFPYAPVLTPTGSLVRDWWHGTPGAPGYGDAFRMMGMGVGTLATGERVSPTGVADIPWGVVSATERGRLAERPLMDLFFPGAVRMPTSNYPMIDLLTGGVVTPISGTLRYQKVPTPYTGFFVEGGTGVNLKTLGLRGYEGLSSGDLFRHLRPYIRQMGETDIFPSRHEPAPGGLYRVEVGTVADERVMFIYTDRPPTGSQWEALEKLRDEARTAFVGPRINTPIRVEVHYSAPTVPAPTTSIDLAGRPAPFYVPEPYPQRPPLPPELALAGSQLRMMRAESGTLALLAGANYVLGAGGTYVQERAAQGALYEQLQLINDWRREHPGEGVEVWFTYWHTIPHPDSMITPTRQFVGVELKTGTKPTGKPPAELFPGGVTVEHERRYFPPISEGEVAAMEAAKQPIPVADWKGLVMVAGGKGNVQILEQLKKSGSTGTIELPDKRRVTFPVMAHAEMVQMYELLAADELKKRHAERSTRLEAESAEWRKLSGESWLRQWWEGRPFELAGKELDAARGHLDAAQQRIAEGRWSDAAFNLKRARELMDTARQKMSAYKGLPTD